jgi:hypothetical protein
LPADGEEADAEVDVEVEVQETEEVDVQDVKPDKEEEAAEAIKTLTIKGMVCWMNATTVCASSFVASLVIAD